MEKNKGEELINYRLMRRAELNRLGLSTYLIRKAVTAGTLKPVYLNNSDKAHYRMIEVLKMLKV